MSTNEKNIEIEAYKKGMKRKDKNNRRETSEEIFKVQAAALVY